MKKMVIALILISLVIAISCSPPIAPIAVKPTDSTSWGTPMRKIWSTLKLTSPPGGLVGTIPYFYNDKIIFGYDTVIDCLDRNSGKRIWSQGFFGHSDDWGAIEMIPEKDVLFALVGETKLACININTGTKIWVYDAQTLLADGFNRYSESPDAFYLVSRYPPQYVIAVSKSNGQELWRTLLPFTAKNYTPKYSIPGSAVFCNGKIYCGFRGEPGTTPMLADGGLFIFDALTGKFLSTKLFPRPDSNVGFTEWRQMTWNNTNVPIIVYRNNSLILPSGYCIVRTDLDGNIVWRKGVSYLGHIALADAPPILLYNDQIYGHNNGGVSTGAFAYSIDAISGNIFWTQPTIERTSNKTLTVLLHNACINSTTLYKISDDNWLIGQDIQSGRITWDSFVSPYFDSSYSNVSGGFAIQGKRVYLLSSKNIYCLERVD